MQALSDWRCRRIRAARRTIRRERARYHIAARTAQYKPSDMPGYQLALQNCATCHSAQYAQTQPPQSPRSYWEATVKKMKKPFGASIADEDMPAIVDYLVKTYGNEQTGTKAAAK